jgi:prolyl oligopeptidase
MKRAHIVGSIFVIAALAACAPEAGPPVPPPQPSVVAKASAPPIPDNSPEINPLKFPYPATKREDVKDTLHGQIVLDPYRWIEDGKSAEVQQWMEAQNALARSELAKLPERDAIAARLKELSYVDEIGTPRHRGSRYFWRRKHADKEKAIVYWKEGKKGEEKVLFDPNKWSTDGSKSLGAWEVSWDGKTVAYAVHKNNSDDATVHVMDVATGKESAIDAIEGGRYAEPRWTPSGDGFYYTWVTTDPNVKDSERPGYSELRFHKVGTDAKKDAIIHERTGDPTTFEEEELSIDGRWLILSIRHGWAGNDLYFMDTRAAKREFKPLVVGQRKQFRIIPYKDQFFIATEDGAPHMRILRADPKKPGRASWVEVVPERKDAAIDSFNIVGGKLAVSYFKSAASQIQVFELDGKLAGEVQLPGLGTASRILGRPDEDEGYYSFESYTMPSEVRSISMKSLKTEVYSKVKVPIDPTPYAVERVFYPSKDETKVSMFIVHKKDLKKDGSSRLMLWGYGGFQISETPYFTPSIYPWLERGGVYASPNLRGGAEYGEEWHQNGMLLKKQNVFDDYIAAAEYLIKEGYTKSDRLATYGRSNGGLLMGAAITQRPDLFSVVLCGVPLLDMIRYHLVGASKPWISEYGSADDPEQFRALYAYSPYHHIMPGTKYPPMLLLSADSDDRVDPMHARKFAAALQAASSGGPVLLRIEKNSGHFGADMVKVDVENGADRYAFALAHTAH